MQVPRGGGELLLILYLGSRWGWVVRITIGPRFNPGKDSCIHWIWGWVGFRGGLETEARVKILCLYRGSNFGRSVCTHTLFCQSWNRTLN
jgi:hypothetical protein